MLIFMPFATAARKMFEAMLLSFDGFLAYAVAILSADVGSPILAPIYDVVTKISTFVITPTATSIIALCFFIEFMKLSLKMDMFKWEWAVSAMAKFAVAKAALGIAPDFLLGIYQTGTGFIKTASSTFGLTNNSTYYIVTKQLFELMTDMKFFEELACIFVLFIPILVVWVVGIFLIVMSYARMFEIMLYIAVSPLPIAFLPLENSNITKKFVLNFSAVVLQGLIMLVIVIIFQGFIGSFLTLFIEMMSQDGDKYVQIVAIAAAMLCSALTLLVMTMKSGQVAKSVLGQA